MEIRTDPDPRLTARPMDAPWGIMKEALDEFEPGFQITREQPEVQKRSGWTE